MNADECAIQATRRWIAGVVIGLDLCPFARRVFEGEKIGYAVSAATTPSELLRDLAHELEKLVRRPIEEIETTLLIHPHVLTDFLEYNDFLNDADRLLAEGDLDGVIQIASFHPDYQFADAMPDAVENFTNRSPFPMLHLLREESVSAVAGNPDELLAIPERNVQTLRALGLPAVQELLDDAKS